jgi:hypothetical protein
MEARMFWIAQPKACSSSVGYTIGEIFNAKVINGLVTKPKIFCDEFPEIQRWHGTMLPRTKEFLLEKYFDKRIMYKEHILPIEKHLDIIRNFGHPLMILLREPEETYDAYVRHDNTVHIKVYGKKRINLKAIKQDIYLFYNRYKALELEKHSHLLFITYRDVVLKWHKTMKRIFDHYGWEMPKNKVPLKKVKYTGIGVKRL